jgi:DNA-directed RNA polymerase subunit K/omega
MEKLTRFESTRLISARALQLSLGAPALVKTKEAETSYDTAKFELAEKVLPLSVIRTMPDGLRVRIEIS